MERSLHFYVVENGVTNWFGLEWYIPLQTSEKKQQLSTLHTEKRNILEGS